MNEAVETLRVRLIADGKDLDATLVQGERGLKSIGATASKSGKLMAAAIGGAAGLAAGAVLKLATEIPELTDAFNRQEAAERKLSATSKLLGVDLSKLESESSAAESRFGLTTTQAGGLTEALTKLGSKAGDLSQTNEAMAALLDLAAARGYDAQAALVAIDQAILGIDEGTDKLFGKNPSAIYAEYADSIGTTAGKLTDQQKAQALLTATLQDGQKVQGEYARFLETGAGKEAQMAAQAERLKAALGALLSGPVSSMLSVAADATSALAEMSERLAGVGDAAADAAAKVENARDSMATLDDASEVLDRYNELTREGQTDTDEFRRVTDELARRFPSLISGYDDAGRVAGVYADRVRGAIDAQRMLARTAENAGLSEAGDAFKSAFQSYQEAQQARENVLELERRERAMRSRAAAPAAARGPDAMVPNQLAMDLSTVVIEEGLDRTAQGLQKANEAFTGTVDRVGALYGFFDRDVDTSALQEAFGADIRRELSLTEDQASELFARIEARREIVLSATSSTGTGGGGGGGSALSETKKLQQQLVEAEESAAEERRRIAGDTEAAILSARLEGIGRALQAEGLSTNERLQLQIDRVGAVIALEKQLAAEEKRRAADVERLARMTRSRVEEEMERLGPVELPTLEFGEIKLPEETEVLDRIPLDGSLEALEAQLNDLRDKFRLTGSATQREFYDEQIKGLERMRQGILKSESALESFGSAAAEIGQHIADIVNSLGSLYSSFSAQRLADIESEKEARLGQIDAEIAASENVGEVLTAEEAKREALLQKRAAAEAEFAEKEKAERREAAERERALAAFNIGLQTFIEVAKAGFITPKAIAIAVAGGIAAVAAATKPIPAFAGGVTGFEGGTALVGETRPRTRHARTRH